MSLPGRGLSRVAVTDPGKRISGPQTVFSLTFTQRYFPKLPLRRKPDRSRFVDKMASFRLATNRSDYGVTMTTSSATSQWGYNTLVENNWSVLSAGCGRILELLALSQLRHYFRCRYHHEILTSSCHRYCCYYSPMYYYYLYYYNYYKTKANTCANLHQVLLTYLAVLQADSCGVFY